MSYNQTSVAVHVHCVRRCSKLCSIVSAHMRMHAAVVMLCLMSHLHENLTSGRRLRDLPVLVYCCLECNEVHQF